MGVIAFNPSSLTQSTIEVPVPEAAYFVSLWNEKTQKFTKADADVICSTQTRWTGTSTDETAC